MWGWYGPSGWDWLWMGAMMLLMWLPFLAVLFLVLWRFAPTGRDHEHAPSGASDARAIARAAYARGEVDRDRFLQTMRDLEEHDTAAERDDRAKS